MTAIVLEYFSRLRDDNISGQSSHIHFVKAPKFLKNMTGLLNAMAAGPISVPGQDDEEVLFSATPYEAPRGLRGWQKFVILIFLILPGFALLFYYGVGIILWFVAGAIYWRSRRTPSASMSYVLTNVHARVITSMKNGQTSVDECQLTDINPVVQNSYEQSTTTRSGNSASVGTRARYGDVVFMKGPSPVLRFTSVLDPEGIVKTITEIKKSLYLAS